MRAGKCRVGHAVDLGRPRRSREWRNTKRSPMNKQHMKFVLVNGRTPRPQSFCALCCEAIGESYLRELTTRLSYCDQVLRR